MTMTWADSFDGYTDPTKSGWTRIRSGGDNPSPNAGQSGGRNGTACLHNGRDARNGVFRAIASAQTNWCVVAFQFDTLPGSNMTILGFRDSGTVQVDVRLTPAGNLIVTRNGTTLAAGPSVLAVNTLYHLDLTAKIDPTTGTYSLKLNGVSEVSGSGANTRATANSSANQLVLGGAGPAAVITVRWDDFVCGNNQGSSNTSSPGDCRVEATFPNGAGSHTDFTPSAGSNYQNVDDASAPNDDTDYNSSATVGATDTYTMTNVTPTGGTVIGEVINLYVRKDDAGSRAVQSIVRLSGGTEANSSDESVLDTYIYLSDVRETKPGGGAFAIADVNGQEIGLTVTA